MRYIIFLARLCATFEWVQIFPSTLHVFRVSINQLFFQTRKHDILFFVIRRLQWSLSEKLLVWVKIYCRKFTTPWFWGRWYSWLSFYDGVPFLTCIYLKRSGKKKSRNIVTSSHPVLIRVWCNMMLEQWNLLETLTLTLATYTHVWARNAEGGGGAGQKISVEAITN